MRTSFKVGELSGLRCVRFKAWIGKSKKLGIPRGYQKPWATKTVAPEFTLEEMRSSYEAEAKRWEDKVMARIEAEKNEVKEEKMVQVEIV